LLLDDLSAHNPLPNSTFQTVQHLPAPYQSDRSFRRFKGFCWPEHGAELSANIGVNVLQERRFTMKYRQVGLTAMSLALLLAGCYTPEGRPDRTASGALGGGVIGAGTGAIIGSGTGHAGAGAAIGGALGALTGGIIGNAIDQSQRECLVEQAPQTLQRVDQGQPLGLADIKTLAKAGVSDEVIISQIRNSRTVYRLTTAEIIDLKDAGVSERVTDFMINTPSTGGAPLPAAQAQPEEVVYVAQPPPPPVVEQYVAAPGPGFVWISGYWWRSGGGWVWMRGHWGRPPHRHAYWVPGRWVPHGHRYAWRPGHWR
jgi:hypothetical protein